LAHLAEKRLAKTEARYALEMLATISAAVWGDKGDREAAVKRLSEQAGATNLEPARKKRRKALDGIAAKVAGRGGKVRRG
jgi:hypothetical protein